MPTFKTLLLAAAFTAGVPALAVAQDRPDDRQHHGDRGNGGGQPDRGDRGERGDPRPQPAAAPQPQAQPQPQRQAPPPQQAQAPGQRGQDFRGDRGGPQGGDRGDRGNRGGEQDRGNRWGPGAPGGQGGYRPDPNRGGQFAPGGRDGRDNGRPDQRPDQYRGGQYDRGGDRGGFGRPGDRGDFRGDRGDFRGDRGQGFSQNWRNDRRFDWRGYRDQHRDIFRGPRYVAPRGWGFGYRRFDIGVRIPSFFFGEQYWISDPWAYRLPPAEGPYRWVRYYNDVLLIDLRSGAVVDAIPGFFY